MKNIFNIEDYVKMKMFSKNDDKTARVIIKVELSELLFLITMNFHTLISD